MPPINNSPEKTWTSAFRSWVNTIALKSENPAAGLNANKEPVDTLDLGATRPASTVDAKTIARVKILFARR